MRDGIVQGQNGGSEVNEKRSDLGLILKAKAKGFLNRIKPKYERNAAVEGDSHNFTMSKPNIIGISLDRQSGKPWVVIAPSPLISFSSYELWPTF